MHEATIAQVAAARPEVSTWLAANAGSGKTRVLIDRVARLLLNGVLPQHILCLTYTKAAATEMQNRLFQRLGAWAMRPDTDLRADLAELGEGEGLTLDRLALARQLFARAIETPGGLRIQTIHSFCATLLRRYPLEAGVSPGFTEMDDRTARRMRDDIVQDMADRLAVEEVAGLARHYTAEDFDTLLMQICGRAGDFATPLSLAGARTLFGLDPDDSMGRILGDVFLGDEADLLAELVAVMATGSVTDTKNSTRLAALEPYEATPACLEVLEGLMLTGAGAGSPFSAKLGSFPTKPSQAKLGNRIAPMEALMGRVETARARRIALLAADKTLALHRFAAPFLVLYAQRKAARGMLDFDDLITRAGRLLNDPALAAWVLFRLDGGIDHILVDEAQDTSPSQWRVIERLAAEFTAGIGASEKHRTLFVVGDKKQSIYSFQGADLTAFDAQRDDFRARFAAVGQPMQDRALDYSFRSSSAVLEVVDATFGGDFPQALGGAPRHLAFKATLPGRVDLWPLVPPAEKTKDEDGWAPVDLIAEDHHTVELARQIAAEIRAMIDGTVQVPDQSGVFHPVHEGDFLILVQRRGPIFSHIIRACKQQGLAIAGADRLKLGEELAVKDIKALLAFLVTPEDGLSLAAALRSPLLGWSEDALYRLAQGRTGHLWAALRNADAPETLAILHDLRGQADFLRPYEMIERILTRHNGRQRLLTRLGPEAEDGIDELLTQALLYEQADVPSLTGFLIWLENDEVQVKRQVAGEGRSIRVMTVHGAKGLEAPIVILPDTADRNPRDRDEVYALEDGCPVWKTDGANSPAVIEAVKSERNRKAREEGLRLLYVALTRARCWLIVAGAGEAKLEANKKPKPRDEWSWYRLVEAGLVRVGAVPDGLRTRYQAGVWAGAGVRLAVEQTRIALPDWVSLPPPEALRPAQALSPSGLGGAKALPGEGDETAAALARGTAIHAMLETISTLDPTDWLGFGQSVTPPGMDAATLLAEAAGVLGDASLAHLFGADGLAEVTLTADLNGARMVGVIDRLIIRPTHVLAVDFKTNRVVPSAAAQVPEGVLRQMGAYVVALRQIYPERRVDVAILWTAAPVLMQLDPDIVTAALSRATIS